MSIQRISISGQKSAAVKAWETRRAKKKADVRHEAAVKAWETRRAKEKADVRHEAAVKAWETRRKPGTKPATEAVDKIHVSGWAYEAKIIEKGNPVRHEAAVKAWETRRGSKEGLTPVNRKLKKSYAATGKAVLRYDEKTEEILVQTASGNLIATGKFLKDYKIKPGKASKIDRGSAAALKAWATRRETQA